jgi:hypothetical protein
MELLELETSTRIKELEEEIGEIGDNALLQMKASEKVGNNSRTPRVGLMTAIGARYCHSEGASKTSASTAMMSTL